MKKGRDDEVLAGEADHGWVNDMSELKGLSDEKLDDLIARFACADEDMKSDLRERVLDAYRGFVKRAKYEISRKEPTNGGKPLKPSTAVSRDLKRIRKSVEDLEAVLNSVDPATKDWFGLSHRERGVQALDGSFLDFELLRRQLDWPLDLLIAASREGENMSMRGPSNSATRDLIQRLANLWERVHGTLPSSDKGRGNVEQDPFLELCRAFHGIGRAELRDAGYDLGVSSLTRVVSDVLKQMKSEAAS